MIEEDAVDSQPGAGEVPQEDSEAVPFNLTDGELSEDELAVVAGGRPKNATVTTSRR